MPNYLSFPQIAKEEREKGKRLLALGWVMNGKEARQKEAGQHIQKYFDFFSLFLRESCCVRRPPPQGLPGLLRLLRPRGPQVQGGHGLQALGAGVNCFSKFFFFENFKFSQTLNDFIK